MNARMLRSGGGIITIPIQANIRGANHVEVRVNGNRIPITLISLGSSTHLLLRAEIQAPQSEFAQRLVVEIRAYANGFPAVIEQRIINVGNHFRHPNHVYHMHHSDFGYIWYHTTDDVIRVNYRPITCSYILDRGDSYVWLEETIRGMNMWNDVDVPVRFVQDSRAQNTVTFGRCNLGTWGLLTPRDADGSPYSSMRTWNINMNAQILRYNATRRGENLRNVIANVSAHEFGHVLGLNDLVPRPSHIPFNGSIMLGSGNVNFDTINGPRPFDVTNVNRLFPRSTRR